MWVSRCSGGRSAKTQGVRARCRDTFIGATRDPGRHDDEGSQARNEKGALESAFLRAGDGQEMDLVAGAGNSIYLRSLHLLPRAACPLAAHLTSSISPRFQVLSNRGWGV